MGVALQILNMSAQTASVAAVAGVAEHKKRIREVSDARTRQVARILADRLPPTHRNTTHTMYMLIVSFSEVSI